MEPLFVTLDALIAPREQMEGADRLTIVPELLRGVFPGEDCSLGPRVLDLTGAVWTITDLGDVNLASGIAAREPFVIFKESEDDFFFASVGCNGMRGAFDRSGSMLSIVQPMASTLMACPDPLADWETQLGEVLAGVSNYKIGGRRLLLLDADGAEIAARRAGYLP